MVKFTKKTAKRKVYKTNRRKGAKPTKAIKAMVKREIAKNVEDKTRQYYALNPSPVYGSASLTLLDGSILPTCVWNGGLQIDQGVGQGDRIGNRIKIKNLTLKGTLVPRPYDVATNNLPTPLQIKMFIFYDKRDITSLPTPATQGNFFQNSSGVGQFNNTIVDMWRPINTDVYRLLTTRTYKLGYAVNTSEAVPPGNLTSGWSNNDFKYNCNYSINLTKYVPKICKFNDNNSVPSSRGLFCMYYAMRADGTVIPNGQITANNRYMLSVTFEDA